MAETISAEPVSSEDLRKAIAVTNGAVTPESAAAVVYAVLVEELGMHQEIGKPYP